MGNLREETLGIAVERAFAGVRGRKPFAKTAVASQAEAKKLKDWLVNQKGNATDGREFNLNEPVDTMLDEPDAFIEDILQRVRSCQAGKPDMVCRILRLLEYMETEFHVQLNTSVFELMRWHNEDERLLTMLKYVHDDSHTRQEIADSLGVNLRTLSDDIGKLRDGYTFLGTEIQINEVKAGDFGSDVHPVFLAMNTADIYTLTVGLTLLSQGTVFESRANMLAGQVYSQLSDKAKALVVARAREADVSIYEKRPEFQNSQMCFFDKLEDSKPFTYFLREPKPCRVTYQLNGKEQSVEGVLKLVDGTFDFRKVVVETGIQKIELEAGQIVRLEPAGEIQR